MVCDLCCCCCLFIYLTHDIKIVGVFVLVALCPFWCLIPWGGLQNTFPMRNQHGMLQNSFDEVEDNWEIWCAHPIWNLPIYTVRTPPVLPACLGPYYQIHRNATTLIHIKTSNTNIFPVASTLTTSGKNIYANL